MCLVDIRRILSALSQAEKFIQEAGTRIMKVNGGLVSGDCWSTCRHLCCCVMCVGLCGAETTN